MSEAILRALMQLFALIVDIDEAQEISEKEKSIVRAFLARQLSSELVDKYMEVFDEFLQLYHADRIDKGSVRDRKRTSLTAVRILGICEKINEELEQRQKFYVIIQLIEYIAYGIEIQDKELEFLETVAAAFNMDDEEYRNILNFVAFSREDIPSKDKVLLINNEDQAAFQDIRHIKNAKLQGEVSFLHIESVNTYVLRYHGNEDLFLNGQLLHAGLTTTFDHGSAIRGSSIDPIYYSDVAGVFSTHAIATPLSFVAREVEFRFRNSDNGIHAFNFSEGSGKMVGIMGGSGVGKSTLLNVLNGNLKPLSGEILINGYNIYEEKDREQLKGVIGFIPQDDLLIEDLTVFQNLYFNARLCLDTYDDEKIREVVKQVLIDLDLYEIRDLKVGKPLNKVISGGQRKRVNIGLELIREPSVLFVDEPTSGLSSVDSEMVMTLLKEQAYKGKLVLINIHQPASDLYKMFDKIIFMDKGGYQIYYGNPTEAVVYFKTKSQHANAREDQCPKCGNVDADQVLQIIEAKIVNEHGKLSRNRKVSPREWFTHFRESGLVKVAKRPPRSELPENYYSIPGFLSQARIFFQRDLLAKLTNKQYVLISLLEAPLLAMILGLFTKYSSGIPGDPSAYVFRNNENLPAFLLMSVIVFLFLGLTIASEEIIKDRKILQRESFLNLSWGSYLSSKILIMFSISAIQALTYVLVGNLIFEIKGMTLMYWLILFSTSCFANLLGLNISAGLNSVITIYILVPFLLIPQILFCGVLVKFEKLHSSLTNYEYVPVIGDLMTSRWAYEALTVEQFKHNRYMKEFFDVDQEISNLNYVEAFLIPTLDNSLDHTLKLVKSGRKGTEARHNLHMLIRQLLEMEKAGQVLPIDPTAELRMDVFDDSVVAHLKPFLEGVRQQAQQDRSEVNRQKNQLQQELMEKAGGIAAFSAFKDSYLNDQLSDMLLNTTVVNKIEQKGEFLVRRYQPVFMEPTSSVGRAHLYAANKRLGPMRIDTPWFNLAVIWLTCLLLYLTLYLDLLRKVLNYFSERRIGRGKKNNE